MGAQKNVPKNKEEKKKKKKIIERENNINQKNVAD